MKNVHGCHKCESCGKLFSEAGYLKFHIHTIHDRCKDYNVNPVANPFLKQDI